MATTIWGVVKDGVVVPSSPLPEGSPVEFRLCEAQEVPPELQEELQAWQRASANSIDMVERAEQAGETKQYASALEFLESLPPGPRAFKTWDEYERHLREERESWDP